MILVQWFWLWWLFTVEIAHHTRLPLYHENDHILAHGCVICAAMHWNSLVWKGEVNTQIYWANGALEFHFEHVSYAELIKNKCQGHVTGVKDIRFSFMDKYKDYCRNSSCFLQLRSWSFWIQLKNFFVKSTRVIVTRNEFNKSQEHKQQSIMYTLKGQEFFKNFTV